MGVHTWAMLHINSWIGKYLCAKQVVQRPNQFLWGIVSTGKQHGRMIARTYANQFCTILLAVTYRTAHSQPIVETFTNFHLRKLRVKLSSLYCIGCDQVGHRVCGAARNGICTQEHV